MKKLIITLFVLITSFTANAKEYNGNEVKDCSQNAIFMFCDLEGEPITGVVKSYYENGNLEAEGNFKDGKQEGLGKSYYDNGNLEAEGNFKDGKLEGLGKEYYENGNLKGEKNFKDGKLEGLSKAYYDNGNLKAEVNFKDDKPEGLFKVYYENGNLGVEINFKDGKAVSGYMYDIDGEKKEMTNAHLHNMTKNLK